MLALKNLLMIGVAVAGLTGVAKADSVYVPGHYETRMQRVEEPGRWVDEEKVIETPGHYDTQWRSVEIPGHFERVERQVWVAARVVGARTGPVAEIGNGRFRIGVALPCTEVIPAHWETRCEQVWVEPRCERREVQVWVPGCRRVEIVRVWKSGCGSERAVEVWVPAHYETRCVERPHPVCDGGSITIGVGFGGRSRRGGW